MPFCSPRSPITRRSTYCRCARHNTPRQRSTWTGRPARQTAHSAGMIGHSRQPHRANAQPRRRIAAVGKVSPLAARAMASRNLASIWISCDLSTAAARSASSSGSGAAVASLEGRRVCNRRLAGAVITAIHNAGRCGCAYHQGHRHRQGRGSEDRCQYCEATVPAALDYAITAASLRWRQ